MLTKITWALNWPGEKIENLLADLAANYAREVLAAHGLVEIEIDHIIGLVLFVALIAAFGFLHQSSIHQP
jgi:trehalose-6-phosphatase